MSADNWNWTQCPVCIKKEEGMRKAQREELERSYGNIPSADFIRRSKRLGRPIATNPTFKENYGFTTDPESGNLRIKYQGLCQVCGFTFGVEKLFDMLKCKEII